MGTVDLRRAMGPGMIRSFDYAALGDPEAERQLKETAAKIRGIHDTAIMDIGRALIAAKDSIPHGKFLEWVEAEFPFGRRTAVNMMQVAAEFGERWENVSHLPTSTLYRLAAPSTPAAVRDAVFDLKPGEIVSPQGVQAAIETAKKAEAPKKPSLKQAEREAQRAKEDSLRQARIAKADREREKETRAREAAAVRVKTLLGDVVPELSEILQDVDSFALSQIVREMVAAYRATQELGNKGAAK